MLVVVLHVQMHRGYCSNRLFVYMYVVHCCGFGDCVMWITGVLCNSGL